MIKCPFLFATHIDPSPSPPPVFCTFDMQNESEFKRIHVIGEADRSVSLDIVNRGEWLLNPTNFFVVGFRSLF